MTQIGVQAEVKGVLEIITARGIGTSFRAPLYIQIIQDYIMLH